MLDLARDKTVTQATFAVDEHALTSTFTQVNGVYPALDAWSDDTPNANHLGGCLHG